MKFLDFILKMTFSYENRGKIKINLHIDNEYVNTIDVTLVKERIKDNDIQDYYAYEIEKWYYPTDECMTVCLVRKPKEEKTKLKRYYASGMTLIENRWQSCGWTIEATSFAEAARIAEDDETFRIHSLSDNVVY